MRENILLKISNVYHSFGPKSVLYNVNLDIIEGEFVALVGPSGCGKSTLLRAIVGTHSPVKGVITLYNKDHTQSRHILKPSSECGIVYQQYSLFPNLTALENVAFGPMLEESTIPNRLFLWKKYYNKRRDRRINWRRLRKIHLSEAAALLTKLKLSNAMHAYPHQLSGGMCQRVAIAQALIMKPRLLLLDEPFGALDEATREELQTMLLELYEENMNAKKERQPPPYTVIIVTHELNEAILVSDRVVCLSQYWNWETMKDPTARGAATIVYDDLAPVYAPDQIRWFDEFVKQREEIRRAGFDPEVLQDPEQYKRFWDKVDQGYGKGVLSDE